MLETDEGTRKQEQRVRGQERRGRRRMRRKSSQASYQKMERKYRGRWERKRGVQVGSLAIAHLWVRCKFDYLTWYRRRTIAIGAAVASNLGEPTGKLASWKAEVAISNLGFSKLCDVVQVTWPF